MVEVTVTDLTTLMDLTHLVDPTGVVVNHHPTDKTIMPTDTSLTQRGVQVAMVLSTATEVLEDVRKSWLSTSSSVDK